MAKHVLMVDPLNFRVEYSINPHMQDDSGALKKVDERLAYQQWQDLKTTFERLRVKVEVLPSVAGLPDMVFSANQSFPFLHPQTKKPTVLLSQMRSEFRASEVAYFEDWYFRQGFQIEKLSNSRLSFESNGDALLQAKENRIWGGFGPRTDKAVYSEMAHRFGFEIILLELIDPNFYHLDTCFALLDENTVAYCPQAFTKVGQNKIQSHFQRTIEISYEENLKFFAANCYSIDGKNIVLQKGSQFFCQDLSANGFICHEVETSEFIKAGGSVFCLKLELP